MTATWLKPTCGGWGPIWWNSLQHDSYCWPEAARRHPVVPCWGVSDNDQVKTSPNLAGQQLGFKKRWQQKHLLLTCVLDVSMVGIGLAFGSERETCNTQVTMSVISQSNNLTNGSIILLFPIKNTYNSGSICACGAVRGGVRLFKRRVVIGYHLEQEDQSVKRSRARLLLSSSGEQPRYLCVFVPLRHLLFLGRVRSLGGSAVDRIVEAVGFLLGAAGGVGLHVAGQYGGDGRRRRRLRFDRRLCRRRRCNSHNSFLQRQKRNSSHFQNRASNSDGHALFLSLWCCAGCWRILPKELFRRAHAVMRPINTRWLQMKTRCKQSSL